MGKKGKARQDKFYHLAKETGYRSRASFKLLQLNRRYEFLQKGRVLIDLCAAPGSWMQVARQHMPVSSLIVGIDLFPIKPIPGCIALQEDITTDQCRQALKRELKTWKADIVLHDGAPNVGQNWIHDAFMQSQLVLSALKLATEFLAPNGWFITKIFRSKDYQPLLWVLQQLFNKIHSTKPQASRLESAEIFVVCQGYKAPDKLDSKFLDPKYVFKEIEASISKSLALQTNLTKKKAEGYEDGINSLHKSVSVKDFFFEEDRFLELLSSATELILDDDGILKHRLTTAEIVECCKDVKVLGRKELKSLLNWRKAIKAEFDKGKEATKDTKATEESVVQESEDEDDKELDAIDRQVEELQADHQQELKRKKKKVLKERRKLQAKMALKMLIAGDSGPSLQDGPMFNLNQIKTAEDLATVAGDGLDLFLPSDEEDVEKEPLPKYAKYDKGENHLDKSGRFFRNEEDSDESDAPLDDEYESDIPQDQLGLASESDREDTDSDDDVADSPSKTKRSVRFADEETVVVQSKKSNKKDNSTEDDTEVLNPLITDLQGGDAEQRRRRRAQLWFDKDVFENLENEEDEDAELDLVLKQQRQATFKHAASLSKSEKPQVKIRTVADKIVNGKQSKVSKSEDNEKTDDDSSSDEDSDSDSDSGLEKDLPNKTEGDTFEIVPQQPAGKGRKKSLPPEALALGQKLIKSKKARRDILDDGWNRYAFGDENLPEWFVEDERRHNQKDLPVTRAEIDAYRQRQKDINVRPIKKVVEAKARKKRRVMRTMEKAKKKVQNIAETMGNTDYDKAQQIRQIYRKAATAANKKPETKYVVAKKGSVTGKRARRPAGVEGRYKLVDLRMKKDNKTAKKAQRRGKHGKKKR